MKLVVGQVVKWGWNLPQPLSTSLHLYSFERFVWGVAGVIGTWRVLAGGVTKVLVFGDTVAAATCRGGVWKDTRLGTGLGEVKEGRGEGRFPKLWGSMAPREHWGA